MNDDINFSMINVDDKDVNERTIPSEQGIVQQNGNIEHQNEDVKSEVEEEEIQDRGLRRRV